MTDHGYDDCICVPGHRCDCCRVGIAQQEPDLHLTGDCGCSCHQPVSDFEQGFMAGQKTLVEAIREDRSEAAHRPTEEEQAISGTRIAKGEAAHPSGAGSGLREAAIGLRKALRAYERQWMTSSTGYGPVRAADARLNEALAATPTVSRDGEIAAIAEALEALELGEHMDDENWPAALYDAGLRVAPSAPEDSLDVETLARAMAYPKDEPDKLDRDAAAIVAAEYARLRSEPTGATPESEG